MKTLMYAALLSILYISIGKSADFYYYQSQKIKIDRVAGFQAVRMASGMDSTTVRRHLSAVRPHKVFQIYKDIYFIETDREIQPDFSVIEVIPVYQNGLVKLVPTSQLIIEFLSSQSIQTVISRYHLKPVQYLNPVTVVVSTDLPADQIITLADEIALLPQVKFAEPNFIRLMPTFSIDPYFLSQWYLENRGGSPAYGVPDADIDAPEAWEISRGSPDIVIAIMDMGVDLQHPDLQENLVVGFDTYDNDNDPSPDRHESHGTCCAGLAAAVTDNNIGIAGVAPECNIMPVRIGTTVSENDPSIIATNAQIANGIDRAWQNGADILSHSWGGGSPSSTITAAIERAKTQGRDGKGCVILFASGNDNTAVDWPATLNSVIAVGATNEDDDRCSSVDWGWGSGSNYGDELDIVAPGNYLYTTDNRGQDGYSPTDYYAYFGGTSGSVPIAAGVAGLVLSVNPDLTSDQVQEVLQNTADDQVGRTNEDTQGCDRYHGHGRINAFQALLSLQEECAITLLEPNGGESLMPFTVITIRWTSFHSTGYVDISLSLDAGANWTEIVTATEDDGQYKWTVLDTPSDLCLVRVSANGDSACSDQSDAPFSIQNNRFIRLVAPNGGESWPEKSIRQIVWESDGIDGNVSIDYSIDLGENWKSVGSAPAAQAGFVWTIPEVTATVNSCLLRLVTLQTPVKTDVSDGPFSIVDVEPDCDITLLIPNGGELWPAGSEQVIIWDPGIIQLPVDISYSNNNGLSYKLFAENEYNDGCYLWTIPQDISGPAMIKIVRSTNEVCFDLSDAIFYLDNAPVPAIQVNNIKGLSGDIITTEIGLVKSNTLVDAFGFDVVYDADHLQLSAVEKGDLTQDWIQFQGQEVEAGRIRIGGFNMNAIESDVSGALARLHFQVICDFCDSCSTSRLLIQSVRDDIQYYNVWNGTFRYATHCKLGDINMDGVLTPGDAQCAFQMYMQQGEISEDNACYTPCLTRSSDANCDGNITPADALRIFTAYLNGDSVLTCEGLNKKAVCPPAMTAHLEQDGRRLIVPVSCEQAIALTAFGMVVEYPADFYEFSTLRRGSITLDWTRLDGYEKQPGELWIGGFTLPGIKHPATANDLLSLEFSLKGDKQPAGEIKIREFLDDLAGASSLTLKIAARKENLLAYNFPNPFNASTTIKYELVSNQHIRIDIYDIRGQLVRRLLDSRRERGEHVVVWNGSDLRGHEVPSGIYYGVIHSDSLKKTFKMLVIR